MLPRAVTEGRRIARNIHRLGRLYLTKSVYAAFLILLAAIFNFTFPFLPRQLTVAAMLTIGIPSFVLALAPSEGPLYRGRLLKALAAFAFPAGIAMGIASLLSFFLVDGVFGGSLEEGRTAATTTLIVLGLCFIVLLERGPGREHITVQSYMLALIAILGAVFAGILAIQPLREFFDLVQLSGGQWFVALLCVAIGLGLAGAAWQLPYVQRLELPEGAELEPDDGPEPTHTPRTGEFDAVPVGPDASEAPTTIAPADRVRHP
jgi:magnesium-transporting ATPase (P-type)